MKTSNLFHTMWLRTFARFSLNSSTEVNKSELLGCGVEMFLQPHKGCRHCTLVCRHSRTSAQKPVLFGKAPGPQRLIHNHDRLGFRHTTTKNFASCTGCHRQTLMLTISRETIFWGAVVGSIWNFYDPGEMSFVVPVLFIFKRCILSFYFDNFDVSSCNFQCQLQDSCGKR